MQTFTHLMIGAVAGQIFFQHSYLGQAACVGSSIVPDLVMIPKFVADKLAGREPLKQQSPRLVKLKECSHSLMFWGLFGLLGLFSTWSPIRTGLFACCLGGCLHATIDILTHKEQRFLEFEPTFLWPLPGKLRGLAIWEYRVENGVLRPKIPEAILEVLLVIAYIILWIV